MAKQIWKFELHEIGEITKLEAPGLSEVVHFAVQHSVMCAWAEVDTDKPEEERTVIVIGTGRDIPVGMKYVGTIHEGRYVWHLYQRQA